MKLMKTMILTATCFSSVACLGAPDTQDQTEASARGISLCAPHCPRVTPPVSYVPPLVLNLSSEQGDYVSDDSSLHPAYPAYFVVGVQNLGDVPNEIAFARPTSDVPHDLCSRTTTDGTLYAHNAAGNYWYIFGTRTKLGTWVAASGSGFGYIPAHCDVGISWSLPPSVDAVMISARSSTYWGGSYYARQITEGASWNN
jgi:hypothetical protein